MAIDPQPTLTKKTPLPSKWKQTKAMVIQKQLLQRKATNPKQRVSFDLPQNLNISYDPRSSASVQPHDSRAKSAAIERANEVQASLQSELPSFVKPMLPSHVSSCFWLGLPKKFCDAHMPKQDETVVLVNEDEQEFKTKFLVDKTGLSGGWRGFSITHRLVEGDALVFQLIEQLKFKTGDIVRILQSNFLQVYIVRINGQNEIDGALGLLNLVPCGMNVNRCQDKRDSRNPDRVEDMDIDLHQEKGLVVFDQSGEGSENSDSAVSEGLRFSQSVLEFKDIKDINDFNIIVDDLVIDSEIPKQFQIKYFDLCQSQKTFLHEDLLKGLNVQLAAGIILETITISDAIKACKMTVTSDDFETWDKTLKAFEEVGMKVGFLRARISKLRGLLFESNMLLEAKRNEQAKAKEEMRVISEKLCGVRDVIKNLDVEIESLKMKGKELELVFYKEFKAPW